MTLGSPGKFQKYLEMDMCPKCQTKLPDSSKKDEVTCKTCGLIIITKPNPK